MFAKNFLLLHNKAHGRLKTSTVIFILDLNTVGIFSGKRRPTGSVFYLRFLFLLAPNCKLLKFSWVKMRTKICLNCRFFMKTHLLQFKTSKCFSSLIVINREENSTLLEQLNCRDSGSNQGPLDLQSNALPTELSRLEKLTTDFRQVFQCLPKIFYFYIIKPMEDWKQAQLYLYWILRLLEFSVPSADPHEAFFNYFLYFPSRLIVIS